MLAQPNFILQEASAGSGKTFSLVKRYISILLNTENPDKFKQLLAITFTNKASLEMKNRVLELLITFTQSDYEENEVLKIITSELNILPEVLHERAKRILSKIIHQYSQFSISTIDKFNLRLMKTFAHDLGLSMNFDVEMDHEKMLIESVQLLFNDIGKNQKLTDALIDIAINNLEEDKKWDITADLITFSKDILTERFDDELVKLQKVSLEDYQLYKKEIYIFLANAKIEIKQIGNNALTLIEEHGLLISDFSRGLNGGMGVYFVNLDKELYPFLNNTQKSFISNETLYAAKASKIVKESIEAIQPKLADWASSSSKLIGEFFLKEKILKTLTSQSLLNEINNKLKEVKTDKNILLISEFNKTISNYLKNQPAPYIYERLGEHYQHFFIDEFQDTSTMQWENIYPLIENAKASSGSALLVGDVKQSIYRFRGANPDLMLHLEEEKETYDLVSENLDTNYRSYSNIVFFNNDLYTFIAKKITNKGHQKIYQNAVQKENKQKGGYIQIDSLDERTTDQEGENYKERVLDKIEKHIDKCIKANYEYSDIAIIVRKNDYGILIAEHLAQIQIPVISDEALLLNSCIEINCIIFYLKWINNQEDKQNLANFCIALKQLNKITLETDITVFIENIVACKDEEEVHKFLIKETNVNLLNIEKDTDDLFTKTEKIIAKLNFDEIKNSYLQSFLEFVFNYTKGKESSLTNFLKLWERDKRKIAISLPKEYNAVKILTVHKSKGLQFPIVILPFADWSGKKTNMWIPTQDKKIPNIFINSWSNLKEENKEISPIIEKEEDNIKLDDLNILYVATTRAVEKLFIITKQNNSKNKSKEKEGIDTILLDFLKENYPLQQTVSIGDFEESKNKKNLKTKEEKNIPFLFNNWETKLEIAHRFLSIHKSKQNKKKTYGNLIHLLLGEIYRKEDIKQVLEKYLIQGLYEVQEKEIIEELLNKIVLHPELETYFKPEDKTIYNERSFINNKGEIVRPDKVIIWENTCVIVDYKTGEPNENHLFQLNQYESLFTEYQYKIIKLLVYLDDQEIKIIELKQVQNPKLLFN